MDLISQMKLHFSHLWALYIDPLLLFFHCATNHLTFTAIPLHILYEKRKVVLLWLPEEKNKIDKSK